jgi:hypothetical protein
MRRINNGDRPGNEENAARTADALLEIIHRRHLCGSTLIATNRIVSDRAAILGDTTATAAILDRFLENTNVFVHFLSPPSQTGTCQSRRGTA